MSSTRNKNTVGNYEREQDEKHNLRRYEMYVGFVNNDNPCFAGNGLLAGHYPYNTLATNSSDVESELFGISSTNLVNPRSAFIPEPTQMKTLSIMYKTPVLLPEPLVIERGQRHK
jgi:hypothetical protein